MRTFYIYNINKYIKRSYEEYPYKLYKLLESAYYTNKYSLIDGSAMYTGILSLFDKTDINNLLNKKYKLENYYCNKNNMHVISSNYEYSKLNVSAYCIKIKTTLNNPSFFKILNNISNDIFIIDYENKDYFWLNKVLNYRQDDINIVK